MSGTDENELPSVVSDNILTFGPFQLNRDRQVLLKDGETVSLGSRALDILLVLTEQPGRIVSSRELLKRVWASTVKPNTMRVHLAMLRRFLRDSDPERDYVQNVTGRGYCFTVPVLPKQGSDRPVVNPSVGLPPGANPFPKPIASTVGREQSIRALTGRMVKHRFVTIVGAGGIGKTTVAIRVADAFAAATSQGICFIDLTSVKDARCFPEALALALGVAPLTSDISADVLSFLLKRKMLLILDSCEPVLDAARTFMESVLRNAPHVQVLATSREPLRAMGESLYRLGPLDVPPAHSELSGAQWLGWTAVRLFIERAGIDSDRPISDAKLSSIADICRKLEGNPLAIEIAAANFDTLGIDGLVASLHNHLHLSLDGRRTALRRHRTLRAMLDWSYELLSPAEQATLRALSVFTNRFDLESASAVAGIRRTAVFEYLIGFTRKSLVLSGVDDGETVFHLPDLSRAYALEKLRDSGEWAAVRSRHAGHDGSFQRMTGMTEAILEESASEDSSIATPAEQFARLLQKEFAPETAEDLSGIERAVQVLAEQALHDPTVISEDPVATIKAIIAKLDTRIAQQVNLIAQHGRRQ